MSLNTEAPGIVLRSCRPGQHRTACPRCAEHKQRRSDEALSVRLRDDGSTVWCCFRCGWKGASAASREPSSRRARPRTFRPTVEPVVLKTGELVRPWRMLWYRSSAIIDGCVAATYLLGRGCRMPHPEGDLRWMPSLAHPSGWRGPTLVGLVTDAASGAAISLHRTWLASDGSGKAALDRPRLLLPGHTKKNGVIRLWPNAKISTGLALAEGIETALALARGFGLAWAAIDAGNLAGLPVLPGIEALTVAVDHDAAGQRAWQELEARWLAAGVEVRAVRVGSPAHDFADFAAGATR